MELSAHEHAGFGPQVIFGMDTQGVCTLSIGPGLEAMGLQPGEIVGKDLYSLYSDPEAVRAIERAAAGETFGAQDFVRGRLLWTRYQPVHDQDGRLQGSIGVSTDVTDYGRARDELVRFKALADDSQDLIAITDEGSVATYLNPRANALDIPVASMHLWENLGEVCEAATILEIRETVDRGDRWTGELRLGLPREEMIVRAQFFRLFDFNDGRDLGTAFIAQDITQLRAADEALKATNVDLKQFQSLVETSGDFIAIAGLDGAVRYVNPAGRQLVGFSEDTDVTSTKIRDYLTPEGVERSEQVEQPAVVAHGHWQGISTLRTASGDPIPVEISSFLMHDSETDEPFALATVQRDITERLAAVKAHEDFITLVAHELRTPLTSVKGYVEIALESIEDESDPASATGHLHVVARNVARMERLVEQILRIAGERSPLAEERKGEDLVRLVEQSVESARPAVAIAGLRVDFVTAPPMTVTLDDEFAEVVDNLIANAVKYTPPGGQVEVALSREDDTAVLSVADSGPGIPPEERDRIFEKFFRGERFLALNVPGLGLGLFITRAIVRRHGGEITVEERPGGGARFVVRLPMAHPEMTASAH